VTGIRYAPGAKGRVLVTRPGLLLWSNPGATALDALWDDRATLSGPLAVIERLSPSGFAGLPDFALVLSSEGSATVVLRGLSAEVETATGIESLDSSGLSTWLERDFSQVVAIRLGAGDATRPIVEGVVTATAVVLQLDATASADDSAPVTRKARAAAEIPAPAPAREPEPELEQERAAPDLDSTIAGLDERESAPTPDPAQEDDLDDELEALFGATVIRSVEEAARRPTPAAEPGAPEADKAAPQEADDVDHDGETITIDEIAPLLAGARSAAPANRPATPIPHLRSATGESIPIDRPVVIGRSPRVTEPVGSENVPHLVSVGANPDVSRNHARFDADGGTVVVTDLSSRNGTVYTLPGRTPTRLRPGEQATLIPGTVVDLGGGATFTVEVGP